jgi:hypothetical protein
VVGLFGCELPTFPTPTLTLGPCAFGGVSTWAPLRETDRDVNRPDDSNPDQSPEGLDAGAWVVSGAHAGGRLILIFMAPPASGPLPLRNPSPTACDPLQSAYFYRPMDSDAGAGGGEVATGQLFVSDGGVEPDGGQRTLLSVSQLRTATWLGGSLPDRTFDVVLP